MISQVLLRVIARELCKSYARTNTETTVIGRLEKQFGYIAKLVMMKLIFFALGHNIRIFKLRRHVRILIVPGKLDATRFQERTTGLPVHGRAELVNLRLHPNLVIEETVNFDRIRCADSPQYG